MKINAEKTNMLCISDSLNYEPRSFFYDSVNGLKIESQKTMKVLGFHFSSSPNMAARVASIKKKFRSRLWMLRWLANLGFVEEELLTVLKTVILPVHDYCSSVYNSSITQSQSQELETWL